MLRVLVCGGAFAFVFPKSSNASLPGSVEASAGYTEVDSGEGALEPLPVGEEYYPLKARRLHKQFHRTKPKPKKGQE
eukprot:5693595-Amphidinium_carterae.1